ncbi:MAG TPA: acyltransferase [Puia sp.]|nr:acyltransferase [Puia sp.]
MSKGYIRSLDGLRAVAILLVMSFHYDLDTFGWAGVQLFFVLSGFLITRILWKEKFKVEPLWPKFRNFWIRRTLRIFPLYYGFLLFLGATYLVFHFPYYYKTFIPFLATYTVNYTRLMPGWLVNPLFTHLWSLSIEEQFYLFFPFFIFLCSPRTIRTVMWSIIFLAPLVRYGLGIYYLAHAPDMHVAGDAVYWNTLSHLDAFCMGGVIPVMSLHHRLRKPIRYFTVAFMLAMAAGVFNFLLMDSGHWYITDLGYSQAEMRHAQHVWSYSLLNFLFASAILVLISERRRQRFSLVRRLLETRWMVEIGKVSYGMYVFHWAIMTYLMDRYLPLEGKFIRMVSFLPYVVLVYLFAKLSYVLYESYFIRLKEKKAPAKVAYSESATG